MKQVLVKAGHVTVGEVPAPAVGAGMCVVAVRHSVISTGTESALVSGGGRAGYLANKARDTKNIEKLKRKLATVGIKGTLEVVRGKLGEFQAPGYSSAGVIVEVGAGVPAFRVGDRVACAGVGYASHAEYNAVPHNLLTPVPDGVELDEAAFVAIGAIALQGVRRLNPSLGETVVVAGLGVIGLLTAQILRAAGVHVVGSDPVASRRALAIEFGAQAAVAPEALAETVAEWSAGYGADGVIICAGSQASNITNDSLKLCRPRGRVIVVGQVGLALEREALYASEVDFGLSCSYGPGRYDSHYEEKGLDYPIGHVRWTQGRNMAEFLRLTAGGQVNVRRLVTQRVPIDEAPAAYEQIKSGEAIAALIEYPEAPVDVQPKRVFSLAHDVAAGSGTVGVAVIGAGGFANSVHLPNLKRIAGARLEAVVARTGTSARQAADRFGARYCATDYREVLADPRVDAVLISTRHNLHAQIAQEAAAAGKHVFVEKPLALSVSDAEAVAAAVEKSGVLLTVGFNRRFSPAGRGLKRAAEQIAGPKMLLYRCNAAPLPAGHWVLDPAEGGGRVLGEAVHFIDFACWLCDGEPVSVLSDHIDAARSDIQAQDNLSIILRFHDGSLATILYSAIGTDALPKERVELYGDGGGAVLEDYQSLEIAGLAGASARTRVADKGQMQLLEHFIQAVLGRGALEITAADGLRATRIACAIMGNADVARRGSAC